jgi:uncharacterized protein (TIGR02145 family)
MFNINKRHSIAFFERYKKIGMMKINRLFLGILLISLVIITFGSCKKDDKTGQKIIQIPLPDSTILFNPNLTYGTVSDIDGNVYKTINIKGKIWMAENLKVTHYRNGDAIQNITDSATWAKLTTGAYCDFSNTAGVSKVYGKLYNETAINDVRNIAPTGWHVASGAELQATVDSYNDYGKLKEANTIHWKSPNTNATNENGFTALPCGFRYGNGGFSGIGEFCYYYGGGLGNYRFYLSNNSDRLNSIYGNGTTNMGVSVRCVKD